MPGNSDWLYEVGVDTTQATAAINNFVTRTSAALNQLGVAANGGAVGLGKITGSAAEAASRLGLLNTTVAVTTPELTALGGAGTQASNSISRVGSSASRAQGAIQHFGSMIVRSVGYMLIFTAAAVAVEQVHHAFMTLGDIQTEQVMANLYGGFIDGNKLMTDSIALSKKYGDTITDVMQTINTFSKVTGDYATSEYLAEEAIKLHVASGIDTNIVTRDTISLMSKLGLTVSDVSKFYDQVTKASELMGMSMQDTATSSGKMEGIKEIMDGLTESAAILKGKGLDTAQSISMVATAIQTMGESGKAAGAKLAQVFAGLQIGKSGASFDEIFGVSSSDFLKKFTTKDLFEKLLQKVKDGAIHVRPQVVEALISIIDAGPLTKAWSAALEKASGGALNAAVSQFLTTLPVMWKRFSQSATAAGLAIATQLLPYVQKFLDVMINQVFPWIEKNAGAIVQFTAALVKLIPFVLAISAAIEAIKFAQFIEGVWGAEAAVAGLDIALGPVGLVAGLAALAIAWATDFDGMREKADSLEKYMNTTFADKVGDAATDAGQNFLTSIEDAVTKSIDFFAKLPANIEAAAKGAWADLGATFANAFWSEFEAVTKALGLEPLIGLAAGISARIGQNVNNDLYGDTSHAPLPDVGFGPHPHLPGGFGLGPRKGGILTTPLAEEKIQWDKHINSENAELPPGTPPAGKKPTGLADAEATQQSTMRQLADKYKAQEDALNGLVKTQTAYISNLEKEGALHGYTQAGLDQLATSFDRQRGNYSQLIAKELEHVAALNKQDFAIQALIKKYPENTRQGQALRTQLEAERQTRSALNAKMQEQVQAVADLNTAEDAAFQKAQARHEAQLKLAETGYNDAQTLGGKNLDDIITASSNIDDPNKSARLKEQLDAMKAMVEQNKEIQDTEIKIDEIRRAAIQDTNPQEAAFLTDAANKLQDQLNIYKQMIPILQQKAALDAQITRIRGEEAYKATDAAVTKSFETAMDGAWTRIFGSAENQKTHFLTGLAADWLKAFTGDGVKKASQQISDLLFHVPTQQEQEDQKYLDTTNIFSRAMTLFQTTAGASSALVGALNNFTNSANGLVKSQTQQGNTGPNSGNPLPVNIAQVDGTDVASNSAFAQGAIQSSVSSSSLSAMGLNLPSSISGGVTGLLSSIGSGGSAGGGFLGGLLGLLGGLGGVLNAGGEGAGIGSVAAGGENQKGSSGIFGMVGGALGGIAGGALSATLSTMVAAGLSLTGIGALLIPLAPILGSLLGGALGGLFGSHETPAQQPDIYDTANYGQFVSNINGAPGTFNGTTIYPTTPYSTAQGNQDLALQMGQFLQTNGPSSQAFTKMTPGDQAAIRQAIGLEGGKGGAGLEIASEKQGQFTLVSGQTISVAGYEQLIQTLQGIQTNTANTAKALAPLISINAYGAGPGYKASPYNTPGLTAAEFGPLVQNQFGTVAGGSAWPGTNNYGGTGNPVAPIGLGNGGPISMSNPMPVTLIGGYGNTGPGQMHPGSQTINLVVSGQVLASIVNTINNGYATSGGGGGSLKQ